MSNRSMRPFSRRTWLKTLAAGTALSPFLDLESPAAAAGAGAAKRVVLFLHDGDGADGVVAEQREG
jgi:hypothetical protein